MRVSPVAHWYKSLDEVLDAAAATALPSHNHDEGIKGAQTVAMAIFRALHFGEQTPAHMDEILSECVEFSGYDINIPKASLLNRFDETCQGTVPVALKIISMATDYEDAVRMAVSLGADADTLGAIVGSIAEAIWGMPLSISCLLKEKEILPDDMMIVLEEFGFERPNKTLVDSTYWKKDYSDVSWDMLYDIEGPEEVERMKREVDKKKDEKRKLMAERAKARKKW
jgi:hypothetical protein